METTTAMALYGAVVATLAGLGTVAQAAWTMTREKPRLKVTGTRGVIATNNPFSPLRHGQKIITVEAANTGNRMITVTSGGIRYKNGAMTVFLSSGRDLPKELSPGQALSLWTDARELHQDFELNKREPHEPFFRDAAGRDYNGRFHDFFWHWLKEERFEDAKEQVLGAQPPGGESEG